MTDLSINVLHESQLAQDAQPGDWVIHGGSVFIKTEESQVFVNMRDGEFKTLAADAKVRLLRKVTVTAE